MLDFGYMVTYSNINKPYTDLCLNLYISTYIIYGLLLFELYICADRGIKNAYLV